MPQSPTIKVCVLGGGISPERAISLRSAQAVTTALQIAGYDVHTLDPAFHDEAELIAAVSDTDIVFPVLHGTGGEDGTLQSLFETHGIAYVGTNAKISSLCFNKIRFKQAIAGIDITSPGGELVNIRTIWQSPLIQKPFVLKPYNGGSSVDTFIVRDTSLADRPAIETALATYTDMLLEELVEGQEITVGVLDDQSLAVIEIIPPTDGEFDYENKYNGTTRELCPPENVSSDIQQAAQKIAQKIHKNLGLSDFSRTDIMIRSSDQKLFVLETNTIPGMTEQSLLPKAAAEAGLSMPELCSRLVETAYSRHKSAI